MNLRQTRLLNEILSQPTAPFREHLVAEVAVSQLQRRQIPYFVDPAGNIVIGVASARDYRALLRDPDDEPLRILAAHMDHPGFHGARWLDNRRLRISWHGGSPLKHLSGARVWLATREGVFGHGQIRKPKLHKSGFYMETAEIQLENPAQIRRFRAREIFGGLAFRAPVWQSGKRLYTKAADDLVGVFAILETAFVAYKRGRKDRPPFIGLLTRAEEVGFVGAIAHFELGWLSNAKRNSIFVSLEASRTLPNAVLGKGPIVRLGDRRTVYQADYLKVLSDVANRVLPGRHQQRIMDGGACEAAAATIWGLPAIGITVPLGNYHNQGFEGGQDCTAPGGPAPEFIHVDDIKGLLVLCRALVRPGLNWPDPWQQQKVRLKKNAARYGKLLKRIDARES
jgi:putative aminopeptidase FrvX